MAADSLPARLSNWYLSLDDRRIRAHLRRTERALREANHDLSPEQRRRRAETLDHLRDYWQRGRFPTNEQSTERVPCFVGANGEPCAMAYLLQQDGRDDLVAAVMADDPTLRFEDVDEGPLVDWVEARGLTPAEAARIQPSYPHAVHFATDCGPLPCLLVQAVVALLGVGLFAGLERVGYRLAGDAFPDNAIKRRAAFGYLTVLNLFLAPAVALLLYALVP
jgi:hypothetical protein